MNKKFVLALMLASGMAFAQSSGSSPGSSDQQQPSMQQTQPPSSQTQSPTSAGQSSLTGCLKGSDSGWVLVAEGQSVPIKGDSTTLGPHNGHQVQVKGSQASDGSFQVTDVVMIAETCTGQQDTSASAGAATGAAAGAAASAASDTSTAAQSTANDAANAAQSAPSSAQSTTPPQSTTSTTPQSTTPPAPTDQSTAPSQSAHQKLPQSASPLPLLGLLGLGSLASGLIARRKK